jgi:hypothetical protein
MVNTPGRVEVPKKTTQAPSIVKRGEGEGRQLKPRRITLLISVQEKR